MINTSSMYIYIYSRFSNSLPWTCSFQTHTARMVVLILVNVKIPSKTMFINVIGLVWEQLLPVLHQSLFLIYLICLIQTILTCFFQSHTQKKTRNHYQSHHYTPLQCRKSILPNMRKGSTSKRPYKSLKSLTSRE